MSGGVPGTGTVLATLVRVTLLRLFRGRAIIVSLLIAALPVLLAALLSGARTNHNSEPIDAVQLLVLALLPPMFIASSLGEEIEDRTTTYLWSRPIPRWSIVVGKLLALVPLAVALVVAGRILSYVVDVGHPPEGHDILAFAFGAVAIGVMTAGIATLVPKHGMALSIVYLVVVDLALAVIPASINSISITRQVGLLAESSSGTIQPAITMIAIAGAWLAVALWRIRRLES